MLKPFAGALALACMTVPAHAADSHAARCVALSIPKAAIDAHGGKWIGVTPEQYRFLQGIYAMGPMTPAGLPYGDRAALATIPDAPGGMIFFIDGDRACTPMRVLETIMPLLTDIGAGTVSHEGASE